MGMFSGEGVASAKLLRWRDLELFKAQQEDYTGLEHGMNGKVMERRLEKRSRSQRTQSSR